VQAGNGLYLSRKADDDLLALCREGAFTYILSTRQVGKSSLMVHAMERLEEEKIASVLIDLSLMGNQVTVDQWYLGLLRPLKQLGLKTDPRQWWKDNAEWAPAQRMAKFYEEVLLAEITQSVVVFIDEIDTTLSLPFTDDFFAAIRALYNARATVPAFRRLSFVLGGVATPGDLIQDPARTPFNIGTRIDLADFTLNEALPLAGGFNLPTREGERVLKWVLDWTGGHPYLTQRLCRILAEQNRNRWTEKEINQAVKAAFLGEASKQDSNLQFVRDMLTVRAPDRVNVLETYREIFDGRLITDEERSIVHSHLKLSGVVRPDAQHHLVIRNRVYKTVFDSRWLYETVAALMVNPDAEIQKRREEILNLRKKLDALNGNKEVPVRNNLWKQIVNYFRAEYRYIILRYLIPLTVVLVISFITQHINNYIIGAVILITVVLTSYYSDRLRLNSAEATKTTLNEVKTVLDKTQMVLGNLPAESPSKANKAKNDNKKSAGRQD